MDADEVVVRVVAGDRRFRIRQLLSECQRQRANQCGLRSLCSDRS
jgi:hypothetical protein